MTGGAAEQIPAAALQHGNIISIYQYGYSPIWDMAFFNNKYRTLADLKGATVGVVTLASATVPILEASLQVVGLSLKDIKMVPIGAQATAVAANQAGRVDAAVWTTSQLPYLDEVGIKYTKEPFPGLNNNYPGLHLAVNRSDLADKEKRETIIRFLRVFTRARKFCDADPNACAVAFKEQTKDPASVPLLEAQFKYRAPIVKLPPEAQGQYGYTNARYWKALVDLQLNGGLIK